MSKLQKRNWAAFPRLSGPTQHIVYSLGVPGQTAPLGSGWKSSTAADFLSNFDGDYQTALEEYGQQVINRIIFARGRIYPSLIVSASAGADVYKSDRMNVRLQVDGQNLTNVLNVIDFGGLFSGNAIGPARSFALRLTTSF